MDKLTRLQVEQYLISLQKNSGRVSSIVARMRQQELQEQEEYARQNQEETS